METRRGQEGYTHLKPEHVMSRRGVIEDTQVVVDPGSGRIVKVGDPRAVREWLAGEEAKGKRVAATREGGDVIAGLTDAHTHPSLFASFEHMKVGYIHGLDKAAVLKKVVDAAKQAELKGKPVVLFGLDTSLVRDLSKANLEEVAPGREVAVFDMSMHGGVASGAMAAKIEALAKSSPRKLAGALKRNGVFSEEFGFKALEVAEAAYTIEGVQEAIESQLEKLLRQGITAVHDLYSVSANQFIASLLARKKWRETKQSEFPVTRFHLSADLLKEMVGRLPELERSGLLRSGEFGELVGLKLIADGSFGSHTARLGDEYRDREGEVGLFFQTVKQMNEAMELASKHGINSVAMHAIGDAGIQRAIKMARQWVRLGEAGKFEPKFRIEHFELPLPLKKTLKQTKELGIWVTPQPNFLLDYIYEDRLGERVRWLCPHQEIVKEEIPMMFGTDGMPDSMLYAIYLATHAAEPAQRLSMKEAILAATLAVAEFEGDTRGLIEEGQKADIIVADSTLLHKLAEGPADVVGSQGRVSELEGAIRSVYKSGVEVAARK